MRMAMFPKNTCIGISPHLKNVDIQSRNEYYNQERASRQRVRLFLDLDNLTYNCPRKRHRI